MNKLQLTFIALLIFVFSVASNAESKKTKIGENMDFGMQVVMTATPGNGEELAKIMLKASELVASLKGCKLYIVQLSTSEKDSVLITEIWGSKEDHQASLAVPGIQSLISTARPLISGMTHQTGKLLGGHGL
ncbi:antibiotic biosynthesis monooxygenase [Exilibacterium tricleocarpae]|uniref:Antibiotic biosynthesis monooxygenase n=1 Tax=Exilibacterium tricleocarpae TaxID=2591008 RepID=A0A545TZJ3_9GAMM|nr:antibiotic biosynthesis monooxygenase [Exilibacterium tricleocarpae]TQV82642.1 antibiotic biosynthesis monooxygenase [Exilibacterium tricleocarpae]